MSDLLFSQDFIDSEKLVVTHNLNRIDLDIRLIVEDAIRGDLVYDVRRDEIDPSNIILVFFKEQISGRVQVLSSNSIIVSPANLPVNRNFGKVIAGISSYTPTMQDNIIGVHTGYGSIDVILPDITQLPEKDGGNVFWKIYKISEDTNQVRILLEDSDQFFVTYSTQYLRGIGAGIEICMYREGLKYWFVDISNKPSLERVQFLNKNPNITSENLNMFGEILDMTNNHYVWYNFRYRINEVSEWFYTERKELTGKNVFSESLEFADTVCQTQLIVEDESMNKFYSIILNAEFTSPYYESVDFAMNDGMIGAYLFQEHDHIDEVGINIIDSNESMIFSGGVNFGNDIINDKNVYKRIFNGDCYGQTKIILKNNKSYTILLIIEADTISGDHTIFSTGRNILSLSKSDNFIQLSVDGKTSTWIDPVLNELLYLFAVIDIDSNLTKLCEVSDTECIDRIIHFDVPSKKGIYFRLGEGTSGDANHQNNEFLYNGQCRTLGFWDRCLDDSQMIDITKTLNTGSLLIGD